MKKLICLSMVALALSGWAAEEKPAVAEDSSFYKANEFSLDAFGLVRTSDFDRERSAAGLGLNYFFTHNFGLGLEAFSGDMNGRAIDDGRAHLIYRMPIGRSAPYVFAGGGRNFERDDNAVSLGVGIEHRFNQRWGAFVDARMDKVIDQDATALGRVGIRLRF